MSSRIAKAPTAHVRARRLERELQEFQKVGPGPWVYVGDFDADEPFTTYWSPVWQNDFGHVTGRRVAFRWGLDGTLEFKGQLDLNSGAVTGTVAFTLPDDWLGETFDFTFPLQLDPTSWTKGVISVDGDTGDLTVYWPIQAAPIT